MTASRRSGKEEIQLCGVVPGHMGAVITVVNVAHLAAPPVDPFEDHRSILLAVIAVLDIDADIGMAGQVRPVEGVGGIGRII